MSRDITRKEERVTEVKMQLDYFFFYTEANVVCMAVLSILLINDKLYSTKQEKQIWFNRTIVAHLLYFASDIGWAAVLSGQLPKTRFLVATFNLSNYILLSLLAYEWFMYMAAAENMPIRRTVRQRNLCRLPMLITVPAMMIAYAAAPDFWISDSGELNIWYYPMMIVAPAFYLLAAFVFSMRNAKKTESRDDAHLYRLIGIYPLGVLGFGLIQTFALNAPLFCFGCTLMMLFFYILSLQTLVSVDSLTRLNNRGQINRYMAQVRYREDVQAFAMMIDIDRFKEINDTFGHAEGDRALILVSEALKQTAERISSPVFIGRYGGDEFTVFIQNPEVSDLPERTAEAIREILKEKQTENQLPYALEVSIGYDVLKGKEDSMEACMIRADKKLYEDKRNRGSGR